MAMYSRRKDNSLYSSFRKKAEREAKRMDLVTESERAKARAEQELRYLLRQL